METINKREAWNKGKVVGQKPPGRGAHLPRTDNPRGPLRPVHRQRGRGIALIQHRVTTYSGGSSGGAVEKREAPNKQGPPAWARTKNPALGGVELTYLGTCFVTRSSAYHMRNRTWEANTSGLPRTHR